MNDTERLVDLFESLSSAHETEAIVKGWEDEEEFEPSEAFDSIEEAFNAAKAVGRSNGFHRAANYVESTNDE